MWFGDLGSWVWIEVLHNGHGGGRPAAVESAGSLLIVGIRGSGRRGMRVLLVDMVMVGLLEVVEIRLAVGGRDFEREIIRVRDLNSGGRGGSEELVLGPFLGAEKRLPFHREKRRE